MTAHDDSPDGRHHDEQQARQQPGDIKLVERHHLLARTGDHRIEHHRQAGREQKPQRPCCRDEPEREAFGVAVFAENRINQSAQRDNGHARPAGEGGEQCTHCGHHHRDPAGHPAEEPLVGAHEPPGGAALGEDVARDREQRANAVMKKPGPNRAFSLTKRLGVVRQYFAMTGGTPQLK